MIVYTERVEGLTAAQLADFFVGWPNPPTPATHLRLLSQSYAAVLALDDATSQVVGFVNAISDGVLSAYIPLLEVLPAYQGRGIGSELVRRMLTRLERFYMVDLLCDPAVQPFYARIGLHRASGMLRRNYERQAGANVE